MNTIYIPNIPNIPNYIDYSDFKFDEMLEDQFIQKLDRNELFNPHITAEELMKPLPNEIKKIPRSMNSFLCFRRKIYLLAVEGGFIDEIRDGRFLTNVVTKVWKSASSEQKNIYTQIAREVREIDHTRYKGVKVEKPVKSHVNSFVNTYMVNFGSKTKTTRKVRNNSRARNSKKPTRTAPPYNCLVGLSAPIIDSSNLIPFQSSLSSSSPTLIFNNNENIESNDNIQNLVDITSFPFIIPMWGYNDLNNLNNYKIQDCEHYEHYENQNHYIGYSQV